jgi:hypothetical protein
LLASTAQGERPADGEVAAYNLRLILEAVCERMRIILEGKDTVSSGSGRVRSAQAVSFADLRRMSPAERGRALSQIVAESRAPANGRLDTLNDEIVAFEKQYGVSSDTLLQELSVGKREETTDILSWLMLVRLKERVESARTA